MFIALAAICVALVCVPILIWSKSAKERNALERHSITADQLHALLASNQETLLFDVRQPLDLLAYSEIIPGARRVPPQEVLDGTSLIPKDKDTIVYCTCPGDKTSLAILRQALAMQFYRVKLLKGGLAAWKANGYPVEPYREVFHLYVPSTATGTQRR